jgi:hypothetical protein
MKPSKGAFASLNPFQCPEMFFPVLTVSTKELRALLLPSCRGYAIASSSDDRMNEPPTSLGLVPHQVSDLEMSCGPAPSSHRGEGSTAHSSSSTPAAVGPHGERCFLGTLLGRDEPMALPHFDALELLTRLCRAEEKEGTGLGTAMCGSAGFSLSPAIYSLLWPSLRTTQGLIFPFTDHSELPGRHGDQAHKYQPNSPEYG